MSNTKQLAVAWRIYADDYGDKLPGNFGIQETSADAGNPTVQDKNTWICNNMDWSLNPLNTNMSLIKHSQLSPYLSASINIYKCPADTYLSPVQRSAGWTARVRSISMSAAFGPFNVRPDLTWEQGKRSSFLTVTASG